MSTRWNGDETWNQRPAEDYDPPPLSERLILEFQIAVRKAEYRKQTPYEPNYYYIGPYRWLDHTVYSCTRYDYSQSEK